MQLVYRLGKKKPLFSFYRLFAWLTKIQAFGMRLSAEADCMNWQNSDEVTLWLSCYLLHWQWFRCCYVNNNGTSCGDEKNFLFFAAFIDNNNHWFSLYFRQCSQVVAMSVVCHTKSFFLLIFFPILYSVEINLWRSIALHRKIEV